MEPQVVLKSKYDFWVKRITFFSDKGNNSFRYVLQNAAKIHKKTIKIALNL